MTKLQALVVADILLSEPRISAALYALEPEALSQVMEQTSWSALMSWVEHLDERDTWQAQVQENRLRFASVLEEIAARLREEA